MTKKEMVQWLKDDVTMSGSINISLSDAEYERIINRELNMIYQLYPVAMKHQYCVIPPSYFYTPEFRNTRTIQFPKCVMGIGKFEEMKQKNTIMGINDPDFSFNKCFMADMWFTGGNGVSLNLDSVTFRTIQWSVFDQLKSFILTDIHHTWDEASHTLLVLGHDPTTNVFCELYTKVSPSELFDDPWVQRFISARAKINVARLLGTFTTNLIGGVQINTSLYTEEANNELNECKEYFKSLREADIFFLTTP